MKQKKITKRKRFAFVFIFVDEIFFFQEKKDKRKPTKRREGQPKRKIDRRKPNHGWFTEFLPGFHGFHFGWMGFHGFYRDFLGFTRF